MSCPRHDHLPTPLVPRDCHECHPRSLSELMGSSSIGTTPATQALLSDIAGTLRQQLRESQEEVRRLSAQVDSLKSEVAGLKRGLGQAKRQATDVRKRLERSEAEKAVIIEAMERMNEEGPK